MEETATREIDSILSQKPEEKLNNLEKFLTKVNGLGDSQAIIQSTEAQFTFAYLYLILDHDSRSDCEFIKALDERDVLSEKKCHHLFGRLLYYLSEICDEFKFDNDSTSANKPENVFSYLLSIVHHLCSNQFKSHSSFLFVRAFSHDKIGVEAVSRLFRKFVTKNQIQNYERVKCLASILYELNENTPNRHIWMKFELPELIDQIIINQTNWTQSEPIPLDFLHMLKFNLERRTMKKLHKYYSSFELANMAELVDDRRTYSDLCWLSDTNARQLTHPDYFAQLKWDKVFLHILEFFYHERAELNFDQELNDSVILNGYQHEIEANSNKRRVFLFYLSLYLLQTNMAISNECLANLRRRKNKLIFLAFLDDAEFLRRCSLALKNDLTILNQIISLVNDLSNYSIGEKHEWQLLRATENLISTMAFYKEINNRDFIKQQIHPILAKVATDGLIEKHQGVFTTIIEDSVQDIVKYAAILQKMSEKDQIEHVSQHDLNLMGEDSTWEFYQALEKLRNLSINKALRSIIYQQLKSSTAILIARGNLYEKKGALELLVQSCLTESHLVDLKANHFALLTLMHQDRYLENEPLLKELDKLIDNLHDTKSNETTSNNKIAISFNKQSHDLAFALKNHLDEMGYQAYLTINHAIETDNNANSRISVKNYECYGDERFQVVKECSTMICIINEYYRQSVFNQAECQYAMQMGGKKIISIVNQIGYDDASDGNLVKSNWIFDLLESSYHKFTLEKLTNRRFLLEFVTVLQRDSRQSISSLGKPDRSHFVKSIQIWNQEDVVDWLRSINASPKLIDSLCSFNGQQLIQLNEIRNESFEFFYQSLNKRDTANYIKDDEVQLLNEAMKSLFDVDFTFSNEN